MPPRKSYSYDAGSLNAMFSTIMEKLKAQDKADLEREAAYLEYRHGVTEELRYIRSAVDKTNGRVTELERLRAEEEKAKAQQVEEDEKPFYVHWKKHGFWAAVWSAVGAAAHWVGAHWQAAAK